MRIRRIVGALLATTLAAGTVGVATTAAPSAGAAAPYETRIVASSSNGVVYSNYKPITYGDSVSFSVNVEANVGGTWEQIYDGAITVKAKTAGVSGVKTLARSDSAYLYDSAPAKGKTTYTVGYTDPEGVYAPVSRSYSLKNVQRDIYGEGISGRTTGFKGTIKPKGKVKITIFRKQGGWKKFKVIRSNAKGRWRVLLPAPRRSGTYNWKLVFAGSKRFAPTAVTGTTTTY